MMDEAQKQQAMGMPCTCGKEGKTYAECCGLNKCACGSGKDEKDCCLTNAPQVPASL